MDRVYALLEREGLVGREQGRGTFVQGRCPLVRHAIGCYGIDFKGFSDPYWCELMRGIQESAHEGGLQVTLLNPQLHRGLAHVDGVLIHGLKEKHLLEQLPPQLPRVALMEKLDGCSSVVADDHGGLAAATEHLLELGHRRIAVLMFLETQIVQMRLDGYRHALRAAGITGDPQWVRTIHQCGRPTLQEHATLNMEAWLREDWEQLGCTAILCQNDQCASGVIEALAAAGLRVPHDVSVVGFDGTELPASNGPALTSVQVPLAEIGHRAVQELLHQIQGGVEQPRDVVLPTELLARASTGKVPARCDFTRVV